MSSAKKEWLDAWHVNPSANKDYDFIDGLRGIAILLVLGCHLIYVNPLSGAATRFVGGFFAAGAFGVTVFFTLSGFLISWPFWKRKLKGSAGALPPGYGWRRFWKIIPPLVLSIVVLTPIYYLRSHDSSYFKIALQWLVGWPLVLPVSGRLNPVMWSLIVEMHFYIVLPLLFVCLKRVPAKTTLWLVFLLFLLVPLGWRWNNFLNGVQISTQPDIDVRFPSLLDGFALGILLAGLESMRVITKAWAWLGDLGIVFLVLALAATSWLHLHPIIPEPWQEEMLGWGIKIASALLLCYVANPQHPRARLFSQPWLRWCGIISYEWYLFHQPIALWARESFGPAQGNLVKYVLIVVGSFLVGLLVAATVYKVFSLPILKRGRSRHTPESAMGKSDSLVTPLTVRGIQRK